MTELPKTATSEMFNCHLCSAVHQNAAIFELVQAFDRVLLPLKFDDDISNSSRVKLLLLLLVCIS